MNIDGSIFSVGIQKGGTLMLSLMRKEKKMRARALDLLHRADTEKVVLRNLEIRSAEFVLPTAAK